MSDVSVMLGTEARLASCRSVLLAPTLLTDMATKLDATAQAVVSVTTAAVFVVVSLDFSVLGANTRRLSCKW